MSAFNLVSETVVTSPVSGVTITGLTTEFNVYRLILEEITPVNDNVELRSRVTTSGSPDSDSNYDCTAEEIKDFTTFGAISRTNDDYWKFDIKNGTGTSEHTNAVIHLFNFMNASEFSHIMLEAGFRNHSGNLYGNAGGGVHDVTEANDGIHFYYESGNIASGVFRLYSLEK